MVTYDDVKYVCYHSMSKVFAIGWYWYGKEMV